MAVSLSDVITYKRLLAVTKNAVFYEDLDMAAGTMTELDTSGYTIDTTDQLNIFEGYQKVFVVNGTILGVADFVNTKINTADAGTVVCHRGNILTGGTSEAEMIVDYVDGITDDAAMNVYGYRTTDETFENGETVTGTNNDGDTISFALSAAETSGPLWYQWTPFGNDTDTYGSMPDVAYLGCLYRGRVVLSGNPTYPHQWYMSRQANPWDWGYVANDAQSPVAGANADAGEIGDIVRALIPYKDDYIIFGCATSMWVLRGDPAAGGSLDELDLTVGIFGANSWCFDNEGNLYFWGTGGIYKLPRGFGPIENLTSLVLPKVSEDVVGSTDSLAPSTHRITMGYDRKRMGILMSVTELADGSNKNFFYDLRTEGFYPETYPDECGVYSLFYYAANDEDYRELLIGTTDGYIRKFDESDTNDDAGASDDTISSYCLYPLVDMAEGEDNEGKVTSLTFDLSGVIGGDTSNVSYKVYVGDDAETTLDKALDNDTASESGTFSGSGRQNRIRTRVRGKWLGVLLYNSTASQTWSINRVTGEIKSAGKIK